LTANLSYIDADRIGGRRMILEGPEHHHLVRVVRSRTGETVRLFAENGARYEAGIDRIEADQTELILLARLEPSGRRSRILLGQALLKAKAMDLVVQKAAELGLFAIAPIRASRSAAAILSHFWVA